MSKTEINSEQLPYSYVENYIIDGKPKMNPHLPAPWDDLSSDQQSVAHWYIKNKTGASCKMVVAWHIIASNYIKNGGITINEADAIIAFWSIDGDPCSPQLLKQ
jgi:hypothetical protein